MKYHPLTNILWQAKFATKLELDRIVLKWVYEEEDRKEADKFEDYDDTFKEGI